MLSTPCFTDMYNVCKFEGSWRGLVIFIEKWNFLDSSRTFFQTTCYPSSHHHSPNSSIEHTRTHTHNEETQQNHLNLIPYHHHRLDIYYGLSHTLRIVPSPFILRLYLPSRLFWCHYFVCWHCFHIWIMLLDHCIWYCLHCVGHLSLTWLFSGFACIVTACSWSDLCLFILLILIVLDISALLKVLLSACLCRWVNVMTHLQGRIWIFSKIVTLQMSENAVFVVDVVPWL